MRQQTDCMPHDHFLVCRIVHLDLKSCNVLIGGDGTAKISDVGLAVLIRDRYLSMTAPAGTFAWVAPEVILGGAHPVHPRDSFSAVVDIQSAAPNAMHCRDGVATCSVLLIPGERGLGIRKALH